MSDGIIKHKYSRSFILGLQSKYVDPPMGGFHPVYIKQKRVQVSSKNDTNHSNSNNGGGKWGDLEKIRAFTSNEDSFIKRIRNKSVSDVQLGELRSLLNKLTDKTCDAIVTKIKELDYQEFNEEMKVQAAKIFLNKAVVDTDFGSVYADIGCLLDENLDGYKKILLDVSLAVFDKFNESCVSGSVDALHKSKCLGLLRFLPYLVNGKLLSEGDVNNHIVDVIVKNIDSVNVKTSTDSSTYADAVTLGTCGIYIELLCKYCEYGWSVYGNDDETICKLIDRLRKLKSIKVIPARVRFIIEDTLMVVN